MLLTFTSYRTEIRREADYCTTTNVQRQTDEFYEMYPIRLSVGCHAQGWKTDRRTRFTRVQRG